MARCTRLIIVAVAVSVIGAPRPAGAQARPGGRADAPTAQLADACDQLIAKAIRKPYGWGWEITPSDPLPNGTRSLPIISLEPRTTPAAGLLCYLAGRALGREAYIDAAMQAARALVAGQESTGRFSAAVVFGARPGRHEELSAVPDRAPTRAALALLLSLIDDPARRNDSMVSSARRAAFWLAARQLVQGGWSNYYPPGAAVGAGNLIYQLELSEYRDDTLALLLAAEVLDNETMHRDAERAVKYLLQLRVSDAKGSGLHLWPAACAMSGMPSSDFNVVPYGIDLTASRRAVQTLLAGFIIEGDTDAADAAQTAGADIRRLRTGIGNWKRIYPFEPPNPRALTRPSADVDRIFAANPAPDLPQWQPPTDVPAILAALDAAKTLGRDAYLNRLGGKAGLRRQLELTLAGLSDQPLTDLPPANPADLDAYLAVHQAMAIVPPERPDPDGPLIIEVMQMDELLWRQFAVAPRPGR